MDNEIDEYQEEIEGNKVYHMLSTLIDICLDKLVKCPDEAQKDFDSLWHLVCLLKSMCTANEFRKDDAARKGAAILFWTKLLDFNEDRELLREKQYTLANVGLYLNEYHVIQQDPFIDWLTKTNSWYKNQNDSLASSERFKNFIEDFDLIKCFMSLEFRNLDDPGLMQDLPGDASGMAAKYDDAASAQSDAAIFSPDKYQDTPMHGDPWTKAGSASTDGRVVSEDGTWDSPENSADDSGVDDAGPSGEVTPDGSGIEYDTMDESEEE